MAAIPSSNLKLLLHRDLATELRRSVDDPLARAKVERQGLLADDILAGFERPDRDLRLEGRRDGDIDERDILVVEQVIDAGMDPRHPVASGDRIRPIQVAIDDRDDLQACLAVCGEVGDVDDRTRSDDAKRTPVLGRDRQVAGGGDAHQLRQHRPVAS